jgi:virginiamycin A acetyltransferase
MTPRLIVKRTLQGVALVCAFPLALLSGFGRIRSLFEFGAHLAALGPGAPGSLLRSAYYFLTLQACSVDTTIYFGAFFAHPGAKVGDYVSIGPYCVIGLATIGERTQLGAHVQITSGRYQHNRDEQGNLAGSIDQRTSVGARCWVGAGAIIMNDVGEGSTLGAGSIVVKAIPPDSVAVGNPARVIRRASSPA